MGGWVGEGMGGWVGGVGGEKGFRPKPRCKDHCKMRPLPECSQVSDPGEFSANEWSQHQVVQARLGGGQIDARICQGGGENAGKGIEDRDHLSQH